MSDRWAVRLPNWLGDTIMALPTLRAVAAIGAPPLLWGPPHLEEALRLTDLEFDYIPYRRRRGAAGLGDALHGCTELLHHAPRAMLLLPNAFEPALLAWAARISRRTGYATDGRGPLLNDVVPEPTAPRHTVHEAARFGHLARHLGVDVDLDDGARIEPQRELRARAERHLPAGGAYLGIAAGSANTPAKRWPPERFAELAQRAQQQLGAAVVVVGGSGDRAVNAEITTALEARDRPAAHDDTGSRLTDLIATLLRCRVVVSNDNGAAHVAAALGRPTVVIFGPTDPQRSAPLGRDLRLLTAGSFCQPCGYRRCPLDHRCMIDLAVDRVFEAVAELWESN